MEARSWEFSAAIQNAAMMHHLAAQQRNGQLVHDHPSSESVVASFHAAKRRFDAAPSFSPYSVPTTQLSPPYLPCERSADELHPITIKQMRLGEHHRGAKVTVRVLMPPVHLNDVVAVVEDLAGTAVILRLHHQPPTAIFPTEEIMQAGSVVIIKEPFFKCATDEPYSLRVDHLSDVVQLEPFDDRIPEVWRKAVPETSSEAARIQGNDAVREKLWAKAARLYSDAILYAVTPEEAQLAFVNRSLVNIHLGRLEQALLDATRMNDKILPTEKALFREIRALYELGSFEKCLWRLQCFTHLYPDNNDAKLELKRVNERLREKADGVYPFARMYEEASQTPALVDCATFSAPVEVRQAPGRGRGLFTVKSVCVGDLLLCEKAFVYKHCDMSTTYGDVMDLGNGRAISGGQVEITTQVTQNLFYNPNYSRPFLELYRGGYKPVSRERADGKPIVDSFLAATIVSLNILGTSRTSKETPSQLLIGEDNAGGHRDTGGIWIMASYLNHSCVGNCRRSFIGDMLILRATANMEPGTELMTAYRHPQPLDSFEDVQRELKGWGFTCHCALCRARYNTSPAQLNERSVLAKRLRAIDFGQGGTILEDAIGLIEEMEDTYAASYPLRVPRLELAEAYFKLGMVHFDQGILNKAMEMHLQGLQALGFELDVSQPQPRRHGVVASTPSGSIKLTRWGFIDDAVLGAFFGLYDASKSMAPIRALLFLKYAQTVYSILVGELE